MEWSIKAARAGKHVLCEKPHPQWDKVVELVMLGAEAFGSRYMPLASCADAADCAATVSAMLGGLSAGGGFLENGVCTRREYTAITLTRAGDTIRVESRLMPLADAPPEDGVCWAEPAEQRAEAEGRPCTELEVISGMKRGPLP